MEKFKFQIYYKNKYHVFSLMKKDIFMTGEKFFTFDYKNKISLSKPSAKIVRLPRVKT